MERTKGSTYDHMKINDIHWLAWLKFRRRVRTRMTITHTQISQREKEQQRIVHRGSANDRKQKQWQKLDETCVETCVETLKRGSNALSNSSTTGWNRFDHRITQIT